MIKVLCSLKRKSGFTSQEFRERYEHHVRLGKKLAGHLLLSYKGDYQIEAWGGETPRTHDGSTQFRPIECEYDCVAEVSCASIEDYEASKKIFTDAKIGGQFYEDDEDFLERQSALQKCDEVDTGSDYDKH